MRSLIPLLGLLFALPGTSAVTENYLYRAELVQAAPGKLLEIIDLYKKQAEVLEAAGAAAPFWMRHSQGDHWDLLLLYPMGSYAEYYGAGRAAKRKHAEGIAPGLAEKIREDIAWQEDVFVFGPPLPVLQRAFAQAQFFHVEMFHALSGRQADLYKERAMENAYQRTLHRPENLVFVRDQGAAWDLFTIGFYRNLKHYAESADIPAQDQDAAARAAGFSAASQIGPYLRSFIASHHDTLAVAVAPARSK